MVLMESNDELLHGDKAPEFSLKGTDEKQHSLEDYNKKLTLVVFMCNHCPYVIPKIDELKRIQKSFEEDLDIVAINSNNHPDYEEDNYENMQKFAKERNLNFTYLFDETQEVAKAYGAVCTPDPFLFDENYELVWKGRINEGGQQEGKTPELYNAIKEFLENGRITIDEKPSQGCSIKWQD